MAAKFTQISEVIEARLKNGEYSVNGMPGERQIALEMGVSHMTARRAVQELVNKGLIPRRPVGRITRADARLRPECDLHIALVAPAFSSDTQANWHNALEQVVARHNGQVRCFGYFNPFDRALTDALQDEFDGAFIVPPFPMPPLLLERLRNLRHKVVTLFHDFTDYGIPCVNLASPRLIWQIARHFAELGHTHVDCLNTQPSSPLISERLVCWAEAAKKFGIDTVVHDHAVQVFDRSDERAHVLAPSIIASPSRRITGLFCTTSAAARGVMRAAHELGIQIGPDLSLASCDNTREAKLEVPSLTTLDNPTPHAVLDMGLTWIRTGGKNWKGPIKFEPAEVPLWKGESTQPVRNAVPIRRHKSAAMAKR